MVPCIRLAFADAIERSALVMCPPPVRVIHGGIVRRGATDLGRLHCVLGLIDIFFHSSSILKIALGVE